ncbi:hypothetical protein [Pyxidicoccus sp. MSG2]|uniref:hypothetical protein n=1 Tax=Pyxidicoccus sp. MSG2 TaxID=2996790 RepID=UPI00226DF10F|nr:hypothetical protein [Pyxidicoccus sp. MSG2]MCY1016419.1 hypothetical protein [Pyxidicoccus sp. MSG2]
MSFVKSVVLAAFAASAVACGGAADMEESSTPEQVQTPSDEQVNGTQDERDVHALATCTGYDGNNFCLVECYDGTSNWYNVGHVSSIPYGNCTEAGRNFCAYYGLSRKGSCWGY